MDLYLPAFPVLARDLEATGGMVQLTLAGMTVGLGLGQLVLGTWSDRVGRRVPLLLSTGLHVLCTIGCALAPSVATLAALPVRAGDGSGRQLGPGAGDRPRPRRGPGACRAAVPGDPGDDDGPAARAGRRGGAAAADRLARDLRRAGDRLGRRTAGRRRDASGDPPVPLRTRPAALDAAGGVLRPRLPVGDRGREHDLRRRVRVRRRVLTAAAGGVRPEPARLLRRLPVGLRGRLRRLLPLVGGGTATSVHAFPTFAVAGVVSPLAGLVGMRDATPLAVVLLGTSTTALAAAGLLVRSGVARRS